MTETNPTIKALRTLLREEVLSAEQMDRHVKELVGKNDRLLAVVAGSSIEAALEGLLKRAMRKGARTESLFAPRNPLSTFSAKIEMAFALNLIDVDTRRNADYIREIRNVFAHRLAPTSFQTPEVLAALNLLMVGPYTRQVGGLSSSARRRFLCAKLATGNSIWGKYKLSDYGYMKPLSSRQRRTAPRLQ